MGPAGRRSDPHFFLIYCIYLLFLFYFKCKHNFYLFIPDLQFKRRTGFPPNVDNFSTVGPLVQPCFFTKFLCDFWGSNALWKFHVHEFMDKILFRKENKYNRWSPSVSFFSFYFILNAIITFIFFIPDLQFKCITTYPSNVDNFSTSRATSLAVLFYKVSFLYINK